VIHSTISLTVWRSRYTTAFDESSSSSSSHSNSDDQSAGAAREKGREGGRGRERRGREGEEGNSVEPQATPGHEGGGRIGKRAWTEEGRDSKVSNSTFNTIGIIRNCRRRLVSYGAQVMN
jgi:hypothetical protein